MNGDAGESPEGSDAEEVTAETSSLSERRRRHNDLLASWIKERTDAGLEKQTQSAQADAGLQRLDLTVEELMKRHTDKKIIASPRDYQLELFERAKKGNVLAVLDTGTGKTLIAALLIRWILDRELQHRADGGKRRITFFLVGGVALAYQQHSMLQCNLDHKIIMLVGATNIELYNQAQWDDIFQENMAVVCTAEILHQCLIRSFINMSEINLLIFDEAHHAKKNHAFSQIMKDYYHTCGQADQPKVFGMTASPVDAKVDVVKAALDLETLLNARIATSHLALHRPVEQILQYSKLEKPYSTELTTRLDEILVNYSFFDQFRERARLFTAELGKWCGDKYWRQCFVEEGSRNMEHEYRKKVAKNGQIQDIQRIDTQLKLIKDARSIINSHRLPGINEIGKQHLSTKVRALRNFLSREFENPTDSKCIVFVGHRQIAFLLAELFKLISTPHLRCAVMVGTQDPKVGETSYSLSSQIKTLAKFEGGEFNCLFATTVAEEGLDVADCNIIVRFELYKTMIQYVQSRGRARHQNSKYIHMLEKGNAKQDDTFKMARDSENKMREFVERLPADRVILGAEEGSENGLSKDKHYQIYKEESTGALLSYVSSLTLLHHFLDFLPRDPGLPTPQATYVVQPAGGKFICEIVFPEQCPIKSIMGHPRDRKALARRSAAFNACLELRKRGLLDNHLMPTYRHILPKMRNAHLALDERKKSSYTVRIKPECWEQGWGTAPTRLYAVVFDLDKEGVCGRPHVPLALLTRVPLPEIPVFPLWPQPCIRSEVHSSKPNLENALECSRQEISHLTGFTLKLFKDIYNKEYENDDKKMSYWIAPILPMATLGSNVPISKMIDWTSLVVGASTEEVKWTRNMRPSDLVDKYLIDPGDGSRRFFSEAIEHSLKPSDRPPEGVAPRRAKFMASILDYSDSTWGSARCASNKDMEQPVLRAYKPTQRRNVFEPWNESETKAPNLAFICPQPLRISTLSTAVVAMAYLLPAIIWRVESYLIAQDACRSIGLTIEPGLALEALTKDSDNTEEHRKEQISVQRGMGRNYERLEFIGDCFLKMATTIALFTEKAADDEFSCHVNRMVMICNKNLLKHALRREFYQFIRAVGFSRRAWYPQGLKLLKGKGPTSNTGDDGTKKKFNDKTIADVCEAMIGAALLSCNSSGSMDVAVKAVTIMVDSDDHTMQKWSDYYARYEKPSYQTSPSTAAQNDLVRKLLKEHNYKFKWPRLAQSAFTHPSYPYSWDQIPNYQRLEFLGDALLDMVAVNFLYSRYPDRDPQWLTEHKMAIVSNKFLGALCVRLGFNRHVRSYNSDIMRQINVYCQDIDDAERKSPKAVDNWTLIAKDPPKCLADIVEAYMGAIFVDSDYNYGEIERFFDLQIAPYFQDMSIYDTFANNHPLTLLSAMLTETYCCQDFRILSEEVSKDDGKPPVYCCVLIIHDKIVADDWSSSSRYGKARVAYKGKHLIEGIAPYEYRIQYRCCCKKAAGGKDSDGIPPSQQVGTAV